jgi:hypothetical protein
MDAYLCGSGVLGYELFGDMVGWLRVDGWVMCI